VNDRIEDPVGTGAALLAGTLVGIVVAMPMLPRTLPVADVAVGPVGAALLAGSLAVVGIPLCVVAMYLVSMRLDR
jgi:hypothetical protein